MKSEIVRLRGPYVAIMGGVSLLKSNADELQGE
jgi:hypothetical protein